MLRRAGTGGSGVFAIVGQITLTIACACALAAAKTIKANAGAAFGLRRTALAVGPAAYAIRVTYIRCTLAWAIAADGATIAVAWL